MSDVRVAGRRQFHRLFEGQLQFPPPPLAADGPKWLITPDFPLSAAEYVLRVLHAEGLRGEELAGNLGWRVLLCDRDAVDAAMKRLESSGAIELENDDDGLQIAVPKDWW